jgi:protein ImuB
VSRLAVVWCPQWPVLAAGAEPGQAAAVLHANRVVAASLAAQADGVVAGLRRREAQGRCPGLVLLDHDPARDARAFAVVARALDALTPLVEVADPGLAAFATRGPSRYHGGDEALATLAARHVDEALAAQALGEVTGPPGVGVADGRFTAVLAARASAASGGRPVVVAPGASAAWLAERPLGALVAAGPSTLAEVVDVLGRLGLCTLGDVAGLGRADLLARFGHPGALAHALASGNDERGAAGRPPPPDLVEQAELEPPVTEAGPVVFTAKRLADHLHHRLGTLGLVCTQVVVRVETEHGERLERAWRHDVAFGPAAVAERVRWQLEGWVQGPAAPTGGLVLVRLTPTEVVADSGRQLGFWGGRTQADDRALRAVARLAGLLGPDAVAVPEWRGGRDPLVAVATVAASAVDLDGREVVPPPDAGPWPGRLPTPSPASVLAEPVPVDVRDAGGGPVGVSGRGLASAAPATVVRPGAGPEAVVAWAGPWPVDERWWDPARHRRRARFQLLTASGTALLATVEGGRWWLEAVYD